MSECFVLRHLCCLCTLLESNKKFRTLEIRPILKVLFEIVFSCSVKDNQESDVRYITNFTK